MILDPILIQEIKEFVGRHAYPEVIKQLKEHYTAKMVATSPDGDYEKRDYYHRMVHLVGDFDKELRKTVDSYKFRG